MNCIILATGSSNQQHLQSIYLKKTQSLWVTCVDDDHWNFGIIQTEISRLAHQDDQFDNGTTFHVTGVRKSIRFFGY